MTDEQDPGTTGPENPDQPAGGAAGPGGAEPTGQTTGQTGWWSRPSDPWSGPQDAGENGGGTGTTAPWAYPASPAPPRAKRVVALPILVAVALITGLVGGGIGAGIAIGVGGSSGSGTLTSPKADLGTPPAGTTQRPPGSVAGVAQQLLPSVVSIEVHSGSEGDTGSGFIIRSDGYILTNNHVISAAAGGRGSIQVSFNDGSTATGQIVGRDTTSDLAVLKVDTGGRKLDPAPLGNSDDVVVGDYVIAIGSPLGLAGTVTFGIVSAKNRPVRAGGEGTDTNAVINAIQTDAAINPGNSGGPLVNLNGQVIGVDSAIATLGSDSPFGGAQSGSIGLGFAIPINQARSIAEQIIRNGKASHPVIGVSIDLTYRGSGARIGCPAQLQQPCTPVLPGGPADKAGLKSGDIIVKVDGKAITSADELIVAIRQHQPGDKIQLTVRRNGSEQTFTLTLGASSS
jgi:putative serine protease PepD